MGPPRLTVVEKTLVETTLAGDSKVAAADVEAAEAAFAGDPAQAANDAAPAAGETATDSTLGSPVHDLIQTIEAGASGPAAPAIEADLELEQKPPVEPAPEIPADPEREFDRAQRLRVLEAVIFASTEPVEEARLATYLKPGEDLAAMLADLQGLYAGRGVSLVKVAEKWAFRTAEDLSWALERHSKQERRLSKAALETLAIVAYHQPVTRAEIEAVRGVTISKGTLDVLMEVGWARPRGRRRAPGKPITYGTTDKFLEHFGLDAIKDLPGLADLKASGLLDANLPPDFKVPEPTDIAALMPDELPLEDADEGDEQTELDLDLEPDSDDGDSDDGDPDRNEPHADEAAGGGKD